MVASKQIVRLIDIISWLTEHMHGQEETTTLFASFTNIIFKFSRNMF